ncbi:MAG: hypothetical protein AAGD17_06995 [Bacteroidota bacterium]
MTGIFWLTYSLTWLQFQGVKIGLSFLRASDLYFHDTDFCIFMLMDFLIDIAVNLLSDGLSFLLGAMFIYFFKKSFIGTTTDADKKIVISNQFRTDIKKIRFYSFL